MRRISLCLLFVVLSSRLFAQVTDNTFKNPTAQTGRVGIGTGLFPLAGPPQDLLHLYGVEYTPAGGPPPDDRYNHPCLRISLSPQDGPEHFGQLAMENNEHYSALSKKYDFVLRADSSAGDLFLTERDSTASIRLTTTPDSTHLPLPGPHVPPVNSDIERLTVLSNGNVGIDLPPDSATGLGKPKDQVQIGGGAITPAGHTTPVPGLTIYGGNRFEGMTKPGGGTFSVDWRGIYFNHYEDHMTGITQRFTPIGSCGVSFADASGGTLQMTCWPPDTTHPLSDSTGSMALSLTGTKGLEVWCDERKTGGAQYYHLFDVWRPGFGGSYNLRNVNGLFLHHTPVLIDTNANATNFTNLTNVHPTLGDGKTWMLAVNGPVLFKEAYVSTDWPDFVFDPGYKLQPLADVEKFIEANHHLPGVPSAEDMAKTGVPLGQTEAKMMQKIEELTKYAIEQNKKIEKLEAGIQELKNQKER